MADSSLSITQQFTGLPMADLIGGPLQAVTDANGNMAKAQTQFILDTCFESKEGKLNPIMINMTLERGVIQFKEDGSPDIQSVTTTMKLPILTIMPINSLGIDSAEVKFEMEVKSASSEDTNESKKSNLGVEASLSGKAGWGPVSVSISGNVSYSSEDSKTHDTHYENSNTAKYTVSVHATQLPIPKGVNTIIDAYSKCIEPVQNSNGNSGSN